MKRPFSRPKGEKIIAQGFSPGETRKSSPPCKGGRMRFVLQHEFVRLPSAYVGRPREAVLGLPSPNCTPPRGVGSAFRAMHQPGIPRAKALGCSLSPFRAYLTPRARGEILTQCSTPKFQCSNTPALHHSAGQDSRTACPTKPRLYSADRSSRPRKRGALHNQNVGEVGRTRTKRRTPNANRRTPNAL